MDDLAELQLNCDGPDEFKAELDTIVEALLNRVGQRVEPVELGFDCRTASTMWRGPTWIAVPAIENSRARYYGGLEYVEEICVVSAGSYVFYFTESVRIMGHWARLDNTEE